MMLLLSNKQRLSGSLKKKMASYMKVVVYHWILVVLEKKTRSDYTVHKLTLWHLTADWETTRESICSGMR